MNMPPPSQILFVGFTEQFIRYTLFAGVAYAIAYWLLKQRWSHRKIVRKYPGSPQILREILHSIRSLFIFALVGLLTIWGAKLGFTRLYWRMDQHSILWFFTSIFLVVILHDTWFYWTHRLMHHPRIYHWCHKTHHLSRNPTPWAAYAFSPAEALIQAAIFPLATLLIPLHPFAFGLFMLWEITSNVIGHTGYEIYPRRLMDSWLGKIMNTPTNHAMHHDTLRGNYGIYFNVWDRLMGTNHERYEDTFRKVTSRPPLSVGSQENKN